MGKVYTRFQTKTAQKPYPMGRHIPTVCSLYKGVPTMGQQGCHYLQISPSNSPLITFTMFNYIQYVQEWLMKKVARWDYKGVSLSTDFLDKGH